MSNKLTNQLPVAEGKPERTPEEAALVMRLKVFINMRWVAIAGVIIATLVASMVFHISFSTLPVYVIAGLMVLYNLVLLRQVRSLKAQRVGSVIQRARTYGNFHIFLDLVTLTVLLHFTGGIENPFIFYFALHAVAASTILHYRIVYMLATTAILMVMLLVGLEYTGVIPHVNLVGFAAPELDKGASYILAVFIALATVLYSSAYMATAISGELRKRQRQLLASDSCLSIL